MAPIEDYMKCLISRLRRYFADRLLYVGLQGSYARGDADESSDIDVMVVLDTLRVSDLDAYRSILQENGYFDRSCGFICGRDELAGWNPLEICHLVHTTLDYYGNLAEYVPAYTRENTIQYILISLNNLYHALCHSYVHANGDEQRQASLAGAYKSAFFILQNLHYIQMGLFANTRRELLKCLTGADRSVIAQALEIKDGGIGDYDRSFRLLFEWCQEAMGRIGRMKADGGSAPVKQAGGADMN